MLLRSDFPWNQYTLDGCDSCGENFQELKKVETPAGLMVLCSRCRLNLKAGKWVQEGMQRGSQGTKHTVYRFFEGRCYEINGRKV
jgi:hypothetical protein